MKTCFKCGVEQPFENFYKHPQMGDGYIGKCKECTKRDVRDNYVKRREQYLEYDRRRYKERPERRAGIKASQRRHATKHAARVQLHIAVANGTVVRMPCEVCGSVRVDAHHDDYDKPLDVRWFCRKHHMEHHRIPHGCTGVAESYPKQRPF